MRGLLLSSFKGQNSLEVSFPNLYVATKFPIPALLLTSCVNLRNLSVLYVHKFPHLSNWSDRCVCLVKFL